MLSRGSGGVAPLNSTTPRLRVNSFPSRPNCPRIELMLPVMVQIAFPFAFQPLAAHEETIGDFHRHVKRRPGPGGSLLRLLVLPGVDHMQERNARAEGAHDLVLPLIHGQRRADGGGRQRPGNVRRAGKDDGQIIAVQRRKGSRRPSDRWSR